MDPDPFERTDKSEECDKCAWLASEHVMARLALRLAYLAYLRTLDPALPPEVSTLRLLIVVVGLVLVVIALVTVGATDQIGNVLRYWPRIP